MIKIGSNFFVKAFFYQNLKVILVNLNTCTVQLGLVGNLVENQFLICINIIHQRNLVF